VRVDRISRFGDRMVVEAGGRTLEADHVVVATGAFNDSWTPVSPASSGR
jgi:glycine/D-amino acid oxidase-like deaminating enzyme